MALCKSTQISSLKRFTLWHCRLLKSLILQLFQLFLDLQKYTSLNNLQFSFFTIKYNISERLTGNQRTEIKMENIEITEEILPSTILEDTFTVGDIFTIEDSCTVEDCAQFYL